VAAFGDRAYTDAVKLKSNHKGCILTQSAQCPWKKRKFGNMRDNSDACSQKRGQAKS
jgi:hypothetical protein